MADRAIDGDTSGRALALQRQLAEHNGNPLQQVSILGAALAEARREERNRIEAFLDLALEVSYSGISKDYNHPAISYIEVQVDKLEWIEFCAEIENLKGTPS